MSFELMSRMLAIGVRADANHKFAAEAGSDGECLARLLCGAALGIELNITAIHQCPGAPEDGWHFTAQAPAGGRVYDVFVAPTDAEPGKLDPETLGELFRKVFGEDAHVNSHYGKN